MSLGAVSVFLLQSLSLELQGKVDNCCTELYHTSTINRNICLCQAKPYVVILGWGCGLAE